MDIRLCNLKNLLVNCYFYDRVKSSYPHPDKPEYDVKEKNYKDADGKVKTLPPNIVTNPQAKNLFKFREHKTDQYERFRELARV